MTIKSIIELLAQADATLPDNNTQLISAADVRNMIKDFIDTMSPAYGAIQLVGPSAIALTPTPVKLSPFTNILYATAPYFQSSAANGQVSRQINAVGLTGATDFLVVTGGVNGPNNDNVTLEIYKNGVATGYKTSVTCSGGADVLGFNIAGISYTDAVAEAVYEVRANAPAGNFNFSNVALIVQAQPVRSFV